NGRSIGLPRFIRRNRARCRLWSAPRERRNRRLKFHDGRYCSPCARVLTLDAAGLARHLSCKRLGVTRPSSISRKPTVPRRVLWWLGNVGLPGFTISTPFTVVISAAWVLPRTITLTGPPK